MRRFVEHWWLIGSALLVAVVVLTCALYAGESDSNQRQQRATQHQAVVVLRESVDDVLGRESALARVVSTLSGPIGARWPALSSVVMSQPLADSTGFIQPVLERDRAAFERQTGLRIVESSKLGNVRTAGRRSLHLVLTAYRQVGPGAPPLGLDVAGNALRRNLLLEAARSGLQLATPPIQFLGRKQPARGVAVFAAVRERDGRLKGWVTATYGAEKLASMATSQMPGVHLTIRDGASTLISGPGAASGRAAVIVVGGRRWSVWAQVPEPDVSAIPWLVLCLGLALTAAMMLILRQATAGARQSNRQLAIRDAEEAAFGKIATLVARGETPDVVFTSVAEQIAKLLDSLTGAVSRFDAATNRGIIVGGWSHDGQGLANMVYALDGVSASAEVFRTGRAARTDAGYASSTDPMTKLGGGDGVAVPIIVAGNRWGALGAAYGQGLVPVGAELRLQRFASLVGLAISNADARDRLERQASTDPLTGIANRRAFTEQLSDEVARAQRYGRQLSLAIIDLDRFKAVNDLHGHQAGDRVLAEFAQLLRAHSRDGDLVARIGGEEFAWLMPETDQQDAHVAASRVREAIEGTRFADVDKVTISAGVCSTENVRDADTLVRNADRALYWAKDGGRNMTFIYTEAAQAAFGDGCATDQMTAPPTAGVANANGA
jgi:diguanylate cyclase (GGDEF)-like protein